MAKLPFFGKHQDIGADQIEDESLEKTILQEDQQEKLEQDISILEDEDGSHEQRMQKVAEREVQKSAEDSLKKLHLIKLGRCPACGEHLQQHLFAAICEACGWHEFDTPKNGPVRVHLRHRDECIEGDKCYVVKSGVCLVLKDDLVKAKIPRESYDYIDYPWSEGEVEQRHKHVVDRMQITCGWCADEASTEDDGFHMTHVAFGAVQERYCFCSDECYEAFRKMYPARVHRNCYERECVDCNLCIKRYGDTAEGINMLAKDFLTIHKKKKK